MLFNKTRQVLTIICLTTLIAVIFSGCTKKKEPPPPPLKSVTLLQLSTKPLTEELKLTGNVKALKNVNISSEVSGTIKSLGLDIGEIVKEGQTVALINDRDLSLQYKAAKAQVETLEAQLKRAKLGARSQEVKAAEIQLNQAKLAYNKALDYEQRLTKLYDAGAIAEQQLIGAQAETEQLREKVKGAQAQLELLKEGPLPEDLAALEAQVKHGKANLALLEEQLRKTRVISPKTGVIVKKLAETGEITAPGKPLVIVAEMNPIVVEVLVPLEVAAALNQEDAISVEDDKGQKYTGTFRRKNPLTDPSTRKVPIDIEIENQAQDLQPGMMVWVTLSVKNTVDAAILIPSKAIVSKNNEKMIFVYNQKTEKVQAKAVKLGKVYDDYLEITEGVTVEDWVVIDGAHYISNNEKVKARLLGSDTP